MLEPLPYILATHDSMDWPEWSSTPRGPLVSLDMAHRGEWMGSVIGDDPETGAPMVYQILRCELCIAIHVWPLPSEDALAQYYQETFYQGPAAQEVAQHERDREYLERCVYSPVLYQCAMLLDKQRPLKLLDIGAGSGIALDTAQRRGWQTLGIEPDKCQVSMLRAHGHTMVHGALAEKQWIEAWKPDIVLCWETLEHQSCPEAFLLQCYDVMPQGALLVISVPNDFSPYQLAACKKYHLPYYWVIPPIHNFFWTPKTLQLCIRRCGFQIISMRGSFPMEQYMLEENGQCYVNNPAAWRQARDRMIATEMQAMREGRWQEQEAMYRANLAERIGRSIICIARKE